MKRLLFLSAILVVISSFSLPQTEDENWGFCIATNGGTRYVSSCFSFPIDDAQAGYPNTKVIRTWRLKVKEELGGSYNEKDFTLTLETKECNGGNVSYRSKLEAMEGRDCFIKKVRSWGNDVKTIPFVY